MDLAQCIMKTANKKALGKNKKDLKIISFKNMKELEKWLEKNHNISPGIWIKFYKKGSGVTSINYSEALDEALCYGWIDGQLRKGDDKFYLQKFTPRRIKSIWSKRNVEHVERLEKEGRMKPSGLKHIEAAQSDGRWSKTYDSPSKMTIPKDFLKELSKNKKAYAFFETLNKTNLYSIGWRLQTAKKSETREKRIKAIIEMLGRGEKFHG
jgi:uncharacterized protein YdeI (YjbR/CyaY-like superfamily)